jgi:hypothetical protein
MFYGSGWCFRVKGIFTFLKKFLGMKTIYNILGFPSVTQGQKHTIIHPQSPGE